MLGQSQTEKEYKSKKIQHTFKSLKTIKALTACFTVRIIKGKLSYSNRNPNGEIGCRELCSFKLLKVC